MLLLKKGEAFGESLFAHHGVDPVGEPHPGEPGAFREQHPGHLTPARP